MSEPQVKIWREGSAGRLRLNRPAALNALTLDMVRLMDRALSEWEHDPSIATVLLDGEGPRALCAGGDVRALHDSGKANDGVAAVFWAEEYRLNARIAAYPKPYVAFMDGIVMGGGVGVSAHGSHRLVTETTGVAMPEVGIGFFPDVGGTLLLARAPGRLGLYLGLTGERFNAADAITAGFADTMIERARWPELGAALAALPAGATAADVSAVIAGFAVPPPAGPLTQQQAEIDRLFSGDSVEAILAALESAGTEFAAKTAATIRKKSPTGVKLTFKAVRNAEGLELRQALAAEYRCALRTLDGTDFYEGVRAALIDKTHDARWQPATIDAVSDDVIARYFEPLGERELTF